MAEGEFCVRQGAVYWVHQGQEELVGKCPQEIGLWWRTQLAKAFGVKVDSPEYNDKVDEMFGEKP